MNKICTSVEQSKKLIELGIKRNTADMHWTIIDQIYYLEVEQGIEPSEDDIPTWSLSALLELMPKNESKTIDLCLGGSNGVEHTFDWFCTCDENEDPYNFKTFQSKSPLDCTFEMICWLKENGNI